MSNKLELIPVTLESKELFDSYFKTKCTMSSEFTFTNLFMWRKSYDIRYAIINDMLCIMPKHGDGPRSATFPFGSGDIRPVIERLLDYFKESGETPLIRISCENAKIELEEAFPDMFLFTEDTASHDYVYKTSDLINLSGKKYHTKRNHVNKFKNTYNYEYRRMTPDDKPLCLEMFSRWCDSKSDTLSNANEQREAVTELLNNWENLDITGGCIMVDGKMAAFSFGEALCSDGSIAVIHLEHADTDFEGIFPMINQQFLEHEWSSFEYVNREEDMGLEGLRKAKLSYRPCFLVKKYVATLK